MANHTENNLTTTLGPRCPLCKRALYNGKDRLIYGDRHERCEALKREARDEEREARAAKGSR